MRRPQLIFDEVVRRWPVGKQEYKGRKGKESSVRREQSLQLIIFLFPFFHDCSVLFCYSSCSSHAFFISVQGESDMPFTFDRWSSAHFGIGGFYHSRMEHTKSTVYEGHFTERYASYWSMNIPFWYSSIRWISGPVGCLLTQLLPSNTGERNSTACIGQPSHTIVAKVFERTILDRRISKVCNLLCSTQAISKVCCTKLQLVTNRLFNLALL